MSVKNIIALKKEKEVALNSFIISNNKARDKLKKLIEADNVYQKEIDNALKILGGDFDSIDVNIVIDHYVYGKTLEKISDEYGYTYEYIRAKHSKIMRKFESESLQ